MKNTVKLALGATLALTLFGALPASSYAQSAGDVLNQIVPSLDYEQADVREALRALFRSKNVSYTIAPDVQGNITVNLKNVTFQTALENITRQVDATYRVESGVFNVVRRQVVDVAPTGVETPTTTPTSTKVVRRIKIRSADPQFIAMMLASEKGSQNYNAIPEMSTLTGSNMLGGGGGGGGGFGGGGGGFGGGGGGFGGGGGGFGGGRGGGGGFGGGGGGFGGGGGGFGGGGGRGF